MTANREQQVYTRTMDGVIPAARVEDLVTTESGEEVLIYDCANHHIHHLNPTSAVIWRLCDGQRTVPELALAAGTELGGPVDHEIVRLALTKLSDAELLEHPVAQAVSSRHSRRAVLRKAAVAGATAVPAVISMTAPTAAQATTGTACGIYTCTGTDYCCDDSYCCAADNLCCHVVGIFPECCTADSVCCPPGSSINCALPGDCF